MGPDVPRPLAEDLWAFDRPLRVFGLAVGSRMTAVRLADGSLFLHSPVALDPSTRASLEALGPVRHVVAPNKVHHFFVGGYAEAWPEARFFAAPGLPEKRRDLRFDGVLGDQAPPGWSGQIDQHLFRGAPYLNEVVFLHRASGTLVLTDLAMNFRSSDSRLTRLWLRAMGIHGRFGASRLLRAIVRDRRAARESLDRILSWDFDRIVVSHGVVLQRHARRLLREAWSWL